ncbi:hypothetical protein [Nostoc sp. UHCC 0870]|uniref:hypothetical protein n=1 Tax=Nostoc sp. UHCC 0870 TaxID=2914041 RepID=UPI001EDEBEF5|nr:hypothetical protein [Nostoc sp. UHCC 0870]UKO97933.1 hypothetical protein L6494_25845 [Nostoc sp. UHCC 0870]
MFRLGFKSLTLGGMVALTTATTALAQVPILQNFQLVQNQNFNCGPHLRTYVVTSLNGNQGDGIRCVKFSEGKPGTRVPRLAWYGEGNWSGSTYRHVGQAIYRGRNLVGFASDIHGNGEYFNGDFPGNLSVQVLGGGSRIRVTGAWNEEWQLVRSTNYNPLPRPKTCGGYFDEYQVSSLSGSNGDGLRCFLRGGLKNTTWFGNGNWGGSTYSHVGTRSVNGYGAGDICDNNFGTFCNTFDWGSLNLTPVPGGFDVTGAWSENWR